MEMGMVGFFSRNVLMELVYAWKIGFLFKCDDVESRRDKHE
jgi:hypothetical protein